MGITALAAETREEFKAEAETYYSEMQELNSQIDKLRESCKSMSDSFKEIGKAYKENGSLPVDEETWAQIKELRKDISEYHSSKEESSVKEMRKAAKEAADSENFDNALSSIKEVVDKKKERLTELQKTNDIWLQIDSLLNS